MRDEEGKGKTQARSNIQQDTLYSRHVYMYIVYTVHVHVHLIVAPDEQAQFKIYTIYLLAY